MITDQIKSGRGAQGFTLIEIAIVLVIIALITGMAVSSGVSVIETSRQSATVKKMTAIDQALLAYRTAHNRLPCPADLTIAPTGTNYGIEAASTSLVTAGVLPTPGTALCSGGTPAANFTYSYTGGATGAAEGAVPVVTLGLPNDFMYDGWGNHIRYAVDTGMTVSGSFINVPIGAVCGAITINDTNGNVRSGNSTTPSTGAIYALISHGPNGHGAYAQGSGSTAQSTGSDNANEQANCHCNSSGTSTGYPGTGYTIPTYIQGLASLDTSDALDSFDDIVTYKERGQLQTPWDKTGTTCPAIYIADSTNTRVQKLDMNTNYISQFGTSGSADGQFSSTGSSSTGPMPGIATDTSGNIWVADIGNNRVQKFNSSGTWVLTIGGNTTTDTCSGTYLTATTCTAFPGTTNCCAANATSCTCSSGTGIGMFNKPTGVATDSSGNVWVADYGNNRVQKFSSSGVWLMTIGGGLSCTSCSSTSSCSCSSGTTSGQFNSPYGVAVDVNGNIWVSDSANNRVQKFNSSGAWMQSVPGSGTTAGSGNGMFSVPRGIFIDTSGFIWVVDSSNGRIQKLSGSGAWMQTIGGGSSCTSCSSSTSCTCTTGSSSGQFSGGSGISVTPFGVLLPTECLNNRTQLFDLGGNSLGSNAAGSTTSSGSGNGQFSCPSGIAVSR